MQERDRAECQSEYLYPISTLNLPMLAPLFQPDDVTHESMSDRTSRTVGGDRSGIATFTITQ